MKSAEEWVVRYWNIPQGNGSDHRWNILLKEIQLDALKEGMRRAADMTYTEHSYEEIAEKMKELETEILTAAEQLTERDLIT